MSEFWTMKRVRVLVAVIVLGVILGRLAVRAMMNLIVGGLLFGGDFL